MNRAAKNYLVATGFTVFSAATGFGLQHQHFVHLSPAVYGAVSLCAFTLGTVGRLGFHDMTWGGVSSHEKLDFRLFLIFYFIGLATGIAALKPEPTGQNAANKTDAGNGSKAICCVSNVLRSPSPDPRRSANQRSHP
jgi:hypothetical protein